MTDEKKKRRKEKRGEENRVEEGSETRGWTCPVEEEMISSKEERERK